jgi:hypothetical protein
MERLLNAAAGALVGALFYALWGLFVDRSFLVDGGWKAQGPLKGFLLAGGLFGAVGGERAMEWLRGRLETWFDFALSRLAVELVGVALMVVVTLGVFHLIGAMGPPAR